MTRRILCAKPARVGLSVGAAVGLVIAWIVATLVGCSLITIGLVSAVTLTGADLLTSTWIAIGLVLAVIVVGFAMTTPRRRAAGAAVTLVATLAFLTALDPMLGWIAATTGMPLLTVTATLLGALLSGIIIVVALRLYPRINDWCRRRAAKPSTETA